MSVEGGRLSKSVFPFTPSRFKGLQQSAAASPVGAKLGLNPDQFGISSGQIQPGLTDLRAAGSLPARSDPRQASPLRLMPLANFCWGARAAKPQPRTRGEQVVIYVTEGALRLDFPRKSDLLEAGSLYFIPAGTAFASRPYHGCAGHALMISPELTRDLTQPMPTRVTGGKTEPNDAALLQSFHDMAAEARRGTSNANSALNCHLGLLALRLLRLEPASPSASSQASRAPDLPLAERFAHLAEDRIADGSTIADLATELGVTTARLDEVCQHKHGKRAVDLVHDLRLHRAAELLRNTDESPAKIAEVLGYTSLAHLSRAFVAATGRLPEQFRQSL